jgi:hypothetical protein
MATETETPLLDERQLELMELIRDSDSVELKLTVPDAAQRSTLAALGIDPLDAQIRQVFFFDTPDLALNQAGIVARARRIQGGGGDSVVKLRPVVPKDLPAEMRKSPSLVVEVDAMPKGFVCSASMKGKLTAAAVKDAVAGRAPLRKLFSKEQRAFFAAHAPEGLTLDGLAVLGPIFVLKVSFVPEGYAGKLVGELWLYPDGSRILELSTKSVPSAVGSTILNARAFLKALGINTTGEQHTKTKTALDFFSNELQEAASG